MATAAPSTTLLAVRFGFALLALLACAPRQDGLTPLPLNQPVELAFGDQRLLLPLDRGKAYRVQVTPKAGDFASLSASLCTLDVHQRVDEGDSHCVAREVTVSDDGESAVDVGPASDDGERRFRHLALRVYADGQSAGPVTLRVQTP